MNFKHTQKMMRRATPKQFTPSRLLSIFVLTCMITSSGLGAAPAWATAPTPLSATGSSTPPLLQQELALQEEATLEMETGPVEAKAVPVVTQLSATTNFSDLSTSDTYAAAVDYVVNNGMMAGTSASQFSPEEDATRGIVTIAIAQMSGESIPAARSLSFVDVDPSHWYSDSTAWCSVNGIAVGYGDNKFGGEDAVTWEQLATILYSYANYDEIDTNITADLSAFQDNDDISDYAVTPVSWALATGMITVDGSEINPQGEVTRGELAQVLANFLGV